MAGDDLELESMAIHDRDMFNTAEDVFSEVYLVREERAASMKDCYALHLSLNSSRDLLGSVFSDGTCCVFDSSSLVSKLSGGPLHSETVTGLVGDPCSPDLFHTCSEDATVKTWDVRQGLAKEVAKFVTKHSGNGRTSTSRGGEETPPKPLTCLDASNSGRLLCAGTEKVLRDTFLLFWDPRGDSAELLGGYWDSHEDDVTSVRFHPDQHSRVASGGVDGIVNVLDVSQPCEDDAIVSSANTESSVQKLTWVGERGVACVTHMEELYLWNDFEGDAAPARVFNRDDVCASIRRKTSDTAYLVDCHVRAGDGCLVVLAGSSCEQNPCLRLSVLKKMKLRPLADLRARKKSDALTRCAVFEGEVIYTGGEDGVVRLWSKKEQEGHGDGGTGKVKSKKKKKGGGAPATPY